MRFSVLASGSAGNATLVERGEQALLFDCGLSLRELERRFAAVDFEPRALIAIVVTHEHDDHVASAAAASRRYRVPVFTTHGTEAAAGARLAAPFGLEYLVPDRCCRLGPFDLHAVLVPHDAREPCQFVVECDEARLGLLTDVGQVTPHLLREYADLDGLVLEFNHDADLLANGPYPPSLRARIGGPYGHLGNHQAAAMLERLPQPRLRHLVAAHLSEKTNTPEHVAALLAPRTPPGAASAIANQHAPLPWRALA